MNTFDLFGDASTRVTYAPHFPLPRSLAQVKANSSNRPTIINRTSAKPIFISIDDKKKVKLIMKISDHKQHEYVTDQSKLFDDINMIIAKLPDTIMHSIVQSAHAPNVPFTVESLIELDDRYQFCVTSTERSPASFPSNARSHPRSMFLPFADLTDRSSGAVFTQFIVWRRRRCELRAKGWISDQSLDHALTQRWNALAQSQVKNIERVKVNLIVNDEEHDHIMLTTLEEQYRVNQICSAVHIDSKGEGVRLITSATSNEYTINDMHDNIAIATIGDCIRFLFALSSCCRVLADGGAFVFHFTVFDPRSAFAQSIFNCLQSCFNHVSVCRTTHRTIMCTSRDMSLQQRVLHCTPAFVVATGFKHEQLRDVFQLAEKSAIADQLDVLAVEWAKQRYCDASFVNVDHAQTDNQVINLAVHSILHSLTTDRIRLCSSHCPINKFSSFVVK